jgi:hypothetical protein
MRLDISEMTLDWVRQTNDPLFADLDCTERHLLYLMFVREMDRQGIAETLGYELQQVTKMVLSVLTKLRTIVQSTPCHL